MRMKLTIICVQFALHRPLARGLIVAPTPDGAGWRFTSMGGS